MEPILPQPVLYLFGGGHVVDGDGRRRLSRPDLGWLWSMIAKGVCRICSAFQWRRKCSPSYEDAFAKIQPNASSYLVIVTRGHWEDYARARVGGADQRATIRDDWEQAGKSCRCTRRSSRKVTGLRRWSGFYAPMGLVYIDGALSPEEEIAVSIVAELIAVRPVRKRLGAQEITAGTASRSRTRVELSDAVSGDPVGRRIAAHGFAKGAASLPRSSFS